MKKCKIALFIGLFIIFLLCGCERRNKINSERVINNDSTNLNKIDIADHFSKQIEDKLFIDANIIVPNKFNFEMDKIEVELKKLDGDEIVEKLYPKMTAYNEEKTIYEDEDMSINILEGRYYFTSNKDRIYKRLFLPDNNILSTNKQELSFVSIEKACENVKSYLKENIGLQNLKLEKSYTLDIDFLKKGYEEIKQSEYWEEDVKAGREIVKENWGKDDGAYVLYFEMTENEIPICNQSYFTRDDEIIEGSSVIAFYTNNGIGSIDVTGYYENKGIANKVQVISVDEVVQLVEKKFENIIIPNPITIDRIRLVYFIKKEKDKTYFVPAWEIHYIEKEELEDTESYIFFEGDSGEEFIFY